MERVIEFLLFTIYLHCYNIVNVLGQQKDYPRHFGWLCLERKTTYNVITMLMFLGMFLTKFSKLPKLTKFPIFQWIIEEKLFCFYLHCYNIVNVFGSRQGVLKVTKGN